MSLNLSYISKVRFFSLMVANLIYFYKNQTFINKNFNRFHKIHTQVFVEQWLLHKLEHQANAEV